VPRSARRAVHVRGSEPTKFARSVTKVQGGAREDAPSRGPNFTGRAASFGAQVNRITGLARVDASLGIRRGTAVAIGQGVTRHRPRASVGNAAGAAIRTALGRCKPAGGGSHEAC